jgi:hypothetical protein
MLWLWLRLITKKITSITFWFSSKNLLERIAMKVAPVVMKGNDDNEY